MVRCIKSTLFIVLLYLSLGLTAQAQTIEQVDPQGLQHVFSLYEAWSNDNEAALLPLLQQNPNLTKRAFVAGLYYVGEGNVDEADLQETATFLTELAVWIGQNLGDSTPTQIVKNGDEAMLATYRDQLLIGNNQAAPPVTSNQNVDEKEALAILKPFLMKLLRVVLAAAYNDPELLIQEIDTYPQVNDAFKRKLAENGVPEQAVKEGLGDIDKIFKLARITAMAELGIVDNYDALTRPLMDAEIEDDDRVAVLLIGLRLAQNQQKMSEADDYLRRAQQIASKPDFDNPVYRYIVQTAQTQNKIEKGVYIPDAELIRAFEQSWALLASYKPLAESAHDLAWQNARWSNRFWFDELSSRNIDTGSVLARLETDMGNWFSTLGAGFDTYRAEIVKNSDFERTQSLISVVLNLVDTVVYYGEVGLGNYTVEQENLEQIRVLVEAFGNVDSTISSDVNLPEPGFPPFSLNNSAYIQELRFRIDLLQALIAPNQAEKSQQLSALKPELGRLVLPENFIDYHLRVGQELDQLGRHDEAVVAWQSALNKANELGFVSRSIEASALLAEEYGRRNDWQKVSEYAAIANEGFKEEMGAADSKTNFAMAQRSGQLAELEAKAHIKSNNPEKALQALSEGHQLTNAAAQLSGNKEAAQATVRLRGKKRQVAVLASKVKQLQEMPASDTRDEMIQKAEKVLADSRQAFLLESRKIRQQFANIYNTSLRFDPLNLPGVQKALPADAAVVQYFPTENELYIFLVTSTDFRLRSVSVKKADIDKQVIGYRRQISRPSTQPTQNLISLSKQLYGFLIEPIEGDLANSKTIIFIPSGRLNFLPFGSLMDANGKPLIASKTILELGRTEDLTKIVQSDKTKISNVLALANATLDLPAAEEEGVSIKEIFPETKLLVRNEATKANLQKFGKGIEVLHLATHGTWDANDSLNNHLKLANDEKLSQEEIFSLNLENTSIVTLSACSTALADDQDVGFVASLAEAFWLAGSETVVASLWQVDDNSTGLLMTEFYQNLSKGQGKGDALRNAQLTVSKNPKYAHPFFWSGFILFGDYR